MEIIEPIQSRRARRAIDSRGVPADVRDRILTAATLAPSCANNQSWRFLAVEGKTALDGLKDCLDSGNYWGKPAPLIIAVITDTNWDARLDGNRDYAYFDTGMACMNLMVQATAEGLYAHPIAGFKPSLAKTALGIPAEHTLLTLIICGFPGQATGLNDRHLELETAARVRKEPAAVFAIDRWHGGLLPPPKAKP